ncbi:MAG: DNA repair protein RecN [uncultured Thiotrichaceae bacterium]|uniref:DNA repair protein RecN n=1 Tax=uncultured Thiotrichaceae bacterium TaxID=298394 RepID=A0A6S6T758_9GAMM|nr:MAG: DNA repair protein RecN [uncultured Thiotrichaceae bacterium]
MLNHIHIRNFAIIEEVELELHSGMTVLTGETGAGKSILIDAIGLVLGDRADSGVVRHGSDKAEITLTIDVAHTASTKQWLDDNDMNADDECILRRIITNKGKSRAWINGTPSNLGMLKQLGEQLVDIHGQHEHQSLMKREFQRQMLDDFANNHTLLSKVDKTFSQWKTTHQRLQDILSQNDEYQSQIDLLSFQVSELEKLGLSKKEIIALDNEHARLTNADELLQTSGSVTQALYKDDHSIYSQLSQVIHSIESQLDKDKALSEPLAMIQSAQIQLQEAAEDLRQYRDHLEANPQLLDEVSNKITEVQSLARKHRIAPEELPDKLEDFVTQLTALQSDDYDIETLTSRLEAAKADYLKVAQQLSKKRLSAAKILSKGVTEAMQELSMQGGTFAITVEQDKEASFAAYGIDHIDFTVSANPGQPLKPLAKVASGGELSRISLAIQMIAAQRLTLPALIFDEVDTGIGGSTAEIVGRELRKLGENRQVLCVTHLPQVASQSHHHNKVTKVKGNNATSNGIITLSEEERVQEVARMMGGVDITESTLNLAKEMISNAG